MYGSDLHQCGSSATGDLPTAVAYVTRWFGSLNAAALRPRLCWKNYYIVLGRAGPDQSSAYWITSRKCISLVLQRRITGFDHLPDLGLLLGLGRGHDACLPAGLLLEPRFAVSFVLTVPMGLVLRGRAGEALRAHNSGDVLLAALPCLSNSLRYYPVGFLLLVLHWMMHPPLCLLLRWGARRWRRRRRRGRGGARWAALHWGADDSYLAAGTISVLPGLKEKGER